VTLTATPVSRFALVGAAAACELDVTSNNWSYSWSTIEVDAYSKLAVGPLSSSSDSGSGSTAGEAGGLHFMPA